MLDLPRRGRTHKLSLNTLGSFEHDDGLAQFLQFCRVSNQMSTGDWPPGKSRQPAKQTLTANRSRPRALTVWHPEVSELIVSREFAPGSMLRWRAGREGSSGKFIGAHQPEYDIRKYQIKQRIATFSVFSVTANLFPAANSVAEQKWNAVKRGRGGELACESVELLFLLGASVRLRGGGRFSGILSQECRGMDVDHRGRRCRLLVGRVGSYITSTDRKRFEARETDE
ncbi:hypothetical protein EDB89DRAFT_2248514 [Lactarius sanguifluus]|nr:hypothetical protein EDB89DRAFT_2248514 [Lactarius sanguifluus]